MPLNLQEQMLVRILRLFAKGNSQREVIIIACVARMCRQNFATQPSHWSA